MLKQEKLRLDIQKKILAMRTEKQWDKAKQSAKRGCAVSNLQGFRGHTGQHNLTL